MLSFNGDTATKKNNNNNKPSPPQNKLEGQPRPYVQQPLFQGNLVMIIVLLFLKTRFSEEHDHMCSKSSGQNFGHGHCLFPLQTVKDFFSRDQRFQRLRSEKAKFPTKEVQLSLVNIFMVFLLVKNRCQGCICKIQK